MGISHHQSPSDHSFKKQRKTAYSRKDIKSKRHTKHRHLLNASLALGHLQGFYKEVEKREHKRPRATDAHSTGPSEGGSIVSVTPVAPEDGNYSPREQDSQDPASLAHCGLHWDLSYHQLCLESPSGVVSALVGNFPSEVKISLHNLLTAVKIVGGIAVCERPSLPSLLISVFWGPRRTLAHSRTSSR